MRIYEFMSKYCQDIIDEAHMRRNLIDLSDYPYDELIPDSSGKLVPVIYIDGVAVPLGEIFTTSREDFVDTYKLDHAGEAYDNYIRNFEILEGEEALSRIRLAMQQEADRLQQDLNTREELELV